MINSKRIGLSLSGGGYRATIYHLGTLKKLKELNLLDKIDVISTNSGGSITGAVYSLYHSNFNEFEEIIRSGVKRSVIKGILTSWRTLIFLFLFLSWMTIVILPFIYNKYTWLSLLFLVIGIIVFLFFQFKLLPFSYINEKRYDKIFLKGKKLKDLSQQFSIAINASNLETGRLFTFSQNRMGDSFYERQLKGDGVFFDSDEFPIARAVAASTAVPFVFSPVKIHAKYFKVPNDTSRIFPRLVDGGVYDNQGLHKITQENSSYNCDIIIVSDAGNMMPFKNKYYNTLSLLIRTSEVFMNRIKNLQLTHHLFQKNQPHKREVAYQSLGWDIEDALKEFIKGIKNKHITPAVLKYHKITKEDIENGEWQLIEEKIKTNINYKQLEKSWISSVERDIARSVKTNLIPLKDDQINALVEYAATITEIMVKLYCPTLFK